MKRVVTLTRIQKDAATGEYQVKAYDQGNNRFPEADYFTDDREDARQTAREMVNNSKGS